MTKNLIVAAWLAAQAPAIGENERGALCAITDAARDRLETAIAMLDEAIEMADGE